MSEKLAAHETSDSHPACQANGDHQLRKARPEEREHEEKEEKTWNRQECIRYPHEDGIGPLAEIAREGARQDANRVRDQHRDQANDE